MEQIDTQLLIQRLRNSVIELLALYASLEDIASLGAFESLNWYDDIFPINYSETPNVFNEDEILAMATLSKLVRKAGDATTEDCWDAKWLTSKFEWRELSSFARGSLNLFKRRGRLSEKVIDTSLSFTKKNSLN